jgi:3-dehydroquinate synthase
LTNRNYHIGHSHVDCQFGANISAWLSAQKEQSVFIISDENIFSGFPDLFSHHPFFILKSGETFKSQDTINEIVSSMLDQQIDRSILMVGLGGGVVTDITGFVSSIYKRGTRLVLIPTSLLSMVDASLGGKNGINAGIRKNMIGTIHQPEQIFFDYSLLKSLPLAEWKSGMAEVIKHAITMDADMMKMLEANDLNSLKDSETLIDSLIQKNVELKMKVVSQDPHDSSSRHVLNFGHTLGHALEPILGISHGEAVSVGMVFACKLSEMICGFDSAHTRRLTALLQRYGLPVHVHVAVEKVLNLMANDKKNKDTQITYVLLEDMGKPITHRFAKEQLVEHLTSFLA